jgi:hypothetical protein
LDKLQNILNQLQQHQQAPPEWCFDAVLQNFSSKQNDEIGSVFEKLKNYSSIPPQQSFDQIFNILSTKTSIAQISILKNYSVDPPQHSFQSIINKLNPPAKKQSPATIISFLQKYKVAAACVGLLCASVAFYLIQTSNNNSNYQPIVNNTNLPVTNPPLNLPVIDSSVQHNTTTATANNTANRQSKKGVIKKSRIKNGLGKEEIEQFMPFSMNGINIPFEDNDFMATFINYRYSDKDSAMFNIPEGQALVIKLDQYNYVSISPKMQGNMKTMYKTKNNGDPTRKAKKMKKKLEAWKNDDRDNFDKKVYKNPLDPLDLFDFLYKKKIIIEADSADVMEEDDEK